MASNLPQERRRSLIPQSIFDFPFTQFPNISDFLDDFGKMERGLATTSGTWGLNIFEDDKQNLVVEAALPGLNPQEIDVTLDKGILWIRGEKKEEEEKKKYYRRSSSSFSYRVALPTQVDENKEPKTTYKDGILQITFSKDQKNQAKKIQVKGQR